MAAGKCAKYLLLKDTVSFYLGIGTATRRANVFDLTIKRDVFIKNSILFDVVSLFLGLNIRQASFLFLIDWFDFDLY